ncbi:MAG: NAD(P)-dependent oxidoreductase [Vicingaceae bacterium]
MAHKVLFIDTVHPVLEEKLTQDGYECIHDYHCTASELEEIIDDYTGLVIRSRLVLTEQILSKAIKLKFIARSGSGLENIDVNFAESNGIKCINSPEGNANAVGEHTLGMLLSLFNKLLKGDSEVRSLQWKREENRGLEISGKTIGIIGYGNTGKAFARTLGGFDCKVLVYDKFLANYGDAFAKETSMRDLYDACDIISLHVPYNTKNHYLACKNFFDSFKKPIFFINTSRGKVLETAALVEAMKSESVLGACLDVLEYEKHSFEGLHRDDIPSALKFLIQSDRTILSPHVAGWTHESYYKLSVILYQKIHKWREITKDL